MSKFTDDSKILSLQHKLQEARSNTRQAEDENYSEELICYYMDKEDEIISQLLKLGCHRRDC